MYYVMVCVLYECMCDMCVYMCVLCCVPVCGVCTYTCVLYIQYTVCYVPVCGVFIWYVVGVCVICVSCV